MSTPAFPPHIDAALNRFTVPPLPAGFANRLLARLDVGDLPLEAAVLPAQPPPLRRNKVSAWRRSGRLMMAVGALGVASATAAASGFFGRPLYVPVVSETLAKAKLVDLPERTPSPRIVAATDAPKPADAAMATAVPTEALPPADAAKAREALRNLHQRLRSDPAFRRLPPSERRHATRQEIRSMVENGEVSVDDLKANFAEQRARRAAIADNRRTTWQSMPTEQQARLRELRMQLQSAPPTERPAIRQEIRRIWAEADRPPDTAGDSAQTEAP